MDGPKPPLRQEHGYIVDTDGRVVILRGLNIMNKGGHFNAYGNSADNPEQGYQWFSNFYVTPDGSNITLGEQWAQFFVEHGFNAARVGIFWNSIEVEPGKYDDAYIKKIVDMVQMFAKYRIFTILDFHQDGWYAGDALNMQGEPYAGFPRWAINPYLISSDPMLNGVKQTCPMPYQDDKKKNLCNQFPYL